MPHETQKAEQGTESPTGIALSEASAYATAALADPELCAYYEAEARKQDLLPRNVAVARLFQREEFAVKVRQTDLTGSRE